MNVHDNFSYYSTSRSGFDLMQEAFGKMGILVSQGNE